MAFNIKTPEHLLYLTVFSGFMVILAVSDVHIGYEKANVELFNQFLEETSRRSDVSRLVILGDLIDMWRRDVSGLFLENRRTVELLLDLKRKIAVNYIVGNHDYHLRKLKGESYPFKFERAKHYCIRDASGEITYVFKHGWEFDFEQCPPVMEYLCMNLTNDPGVIRSGFWGWITSHHNASKCVTKAIKANVKGRYNLFTRKNRRTSYLSSLQTPAFQRQSKGFTVVESIARDSLKPGEVLVFGHTHRPLVSDAIAFGTRLEGRVRCGVVNASAEHEVLSQG
jgi:UDP-2,3-diacylglucosamine pyrophosphatase LpxH